MEEAEAFRPLVRDDSSPEGRVLYQWARDYLMSPNAALGRTGAVCPYAAAAVQLRSVHYLTVLGVPSQEAILGVVHRARQQFVAMEKNPLLSFIIVFPELNTSEGKASLAQIQKEAKLEFVKHGLMLGEFFEGNLVPGLHNPAFAPLQSPMPLLAIRKMLVNDIPFMDQAADKPAVRVELISAHLDVLKDEMSPEMKQKVLARRARAVEEEVA